MLPTNPGGLAGNQSLNYTARGGTPPASRPKDVAFSGGHSSVGRALQWH